ncbi:PAS/PAC sensor signal transduction histidine kinase [Cellulophaga algicola DSM 14237]|uniref:histidine kinase n=1 Tax=Cellulophaga algicola (strain DSM 14237 / IC166 / ACAM 630) TaxID=688270 RepID=E6XBN1_CELAD|nr:PAS domain-containing sensor histidine kinase [Cellulophaga algicola]ADV47866.1 PAS/PAC sensor signal transduction histidine kinase [Cellulophaga algicola DSM 14237]
MEVNHHNTSVQDLYQEIEQLKEQNKKLLLFHSSKQEIQKSYDELLLKLNTDSEVYTHTILDNMGDSVFVKDNHSRLLLVNNAFCEMFEMSQDNIIGKTLAEDVSETERDKFLEVDKQVLLDGVENISEETITLKSGGHRMISTRKTRFINTSGKKFIIGAIRDITINKKAERALFESESQLRELNITKDKLFAIIAHDLRSPFNNILTLSGLIEDAIKENDISLLGEYVSLIKTTSKATLTLLENLLTWSNAQRDQDNLQKEKLNIQDLIEEVQEFIQHLAKTKNIAIKEPNLECIKIYSDAKMLKTILRNLLSNAVKFTKSGGDIGISVIKRSDNLEFVVSDSGIGMSAKVCEQLFEAGTTISSRGTANEIGSGFGLVLCKEFVEKLGGKIWVESEIGKGSDFKFTLPVC